MTVYELSIDDLDATPLIFPIPEEREKFKRLAEEKITNGISVKDEWEEFLVLKREPKQDRDFYDIDDLGVFIVSGKAFDLISPILDESVELLKLKSDDGDLYLLNVVETTDCFDKDNADCIVFPTGGIVSFSMLSFSPDKIRRPVFRISELPYRTLITEDILQIYYLNGLSGLNLTDEEYVGDVNEDEI